MLASSAENFPGIMRPAIDQSYWALLYFGPLVYLGYFFLMSVLLAVVVDEYLHSARRLVQEEEHKERKGLLKAFRLLDPTCSGVVAISTWCRMLRLLRRDMSQQEAEIRCAPRRADVASLWPSAARQPRRCA